MIRPEPLRTSRLVLRRPDPADAEELFRSCFGDPAVMEFLTWKLHRGPEEARNLLAALARRWDEGSQAHWVIAPSAGGDPFGLISLRLEARANLSYLLSREQWGKGIMTEAAGAACAWALGRPEIDRLWAFCETGNAVSIRVLEKIGFREEPTRPRYAVFPNLAGEPRDCRLFTRGPGEESL